MVITSGSLVVQHCHITDATVLMLVAVLLSQVERSMYDSQDYAP